MSGLVAGVDGGGTKTHVMIARADDGSVVAEAEGPGSAVAPGHAPESARVIAATVAVALEKITEGDRTLSLLLVGVAGVGRKDERENLAAARLRPAIIDLQIGACDLRARSVTR